MINKTVQNEKNWHEEFYSDGKFPGESIRSPLLKFYLATVYPKYIFENLQKISGLRVLDIGCGRGIERAQQFLNRNCSYTGIDISDSCIIANKNDALSKKLNLTYLVEDANKLSSLKGKKYDLIILTGTLHHLELAQALPNIRSITNDNGGQVIFYEPMGTNPFINLFRSLTPKLRSPDEHPLTFDDLKFIKKYFKNTCYEMHSLSSLIIIPFAFIKIKSLNKFLNKLSFIFGKLDKKFLCKIPLLKRLSWTVIIKAKT